MMKKHFVGIFNFQRLLTIKLLIVLTFTCISLAASTTTFAQADVADEIKTLLENHYFEPVNPQVLEGDTIEEILERLDDPYTTYMTQKEYANFQDSIDQSFYGIGIYFEMVTEGVLVTSVIAESPAEEAELLPSDVIIKADGKDMSGLPNEKTISIIRGPKNTVIPLEIKRNGEIIETSVTRDEVNISNVTGELMDNDIGYIEINSFGSEIGKLFEKELELLTEQGADKWIIDLRNNSGGYLNGARNILGYLIQDEIALITESKNKRVNFTANEQDMVLDDPLIVLVNQYSASASEIVAAALKDHERALLIGETSYGKGTVQSLFNLTDDSVLKMTTRQFYSPSGEPINDIGVSPHLKMNEENMISAAQLILGSKDESTEIEINEMEHEIEHHKNRYFPLFQALLRFLSLRQ